MCSRAKNKSSSVVHIRTSRYNNISVRNVVNNVRIVAQFTRISRMGVGMQWVHSKRYFRGNNSPAIAARNVGVRKYGVYLRIYFTYST